MVYDTSNPPRKRCSKCKEYFPPTSEYFTKLSKSKDGLAYWCRSCGVKYHTESNRKIGHKPLNRSITQDGNRRCTKCHEWYPDTFEYFYKDPQKKTGKNPACKTCNDAQKQNWRKENPDKVLATSRRQQANMTPEQKARQNENSRRISKEKYWADPGAASRKFKEYYQRTREYHVLRRAKYRKEHPDKIIETGRKSDRKRIGTPAYIAKRHRRVARKIGLPDNFTAQDWQHALKHFDNRCAVCGKVPDFWTVLAPDHWIPLASPDCIGTVPKNIIPLCHARKDGQGTCNNQKHNRNAAEWLTSKYGKRKASKILKRIQEYFDSLE